MSAPRNNTERPSLETSLRTLNAKLIARLRAAEAAKSAEESSRHAAEQSLYAAQRARRLAEARISEMTYTLNEEQQQVEALRANVVTLSADVIKLSADLAKERERREMAELNERAAHKMDVHASAPFSYSTIVSGDTSALEQTSPRSEADTGGVETLEERRVSTASPSYPAGIQGWLANALRWFGTLWTRLRLFVAPTPRSERRPLLG